MAPNSSTSAREDSVTIKLFSKYRTKCPCDNTVWNPASENVLLSGRASGARKMPRRFLNALTTITNTGNSAITV